MAGRSSTTFKKRQKELARQDKQREKAAKREQRKRRQSWYTVPSMERTRWLRPRIVTNPQSDGWTKLC